MLRKTLNIHERFLRHIWSRQYLKTELFTSDGKPIKVLNVGKFNPDGGPDFTNAKIKIDTITYAGDVEIHRTVFDWIQHHHQEDPKYNSVVLHVVLDAEVNIPPTISQSGRQIPVLVLGNFLSDSIHAIWHKAILDERAKSDNTIPCSEKNILITADIIEHWLEKLAIERLEIKLRRFEERLKQLAQEKKMSVKERQILYGKDFAVEALEEIPPPMFELTQKDFSQKELWEQILYEGIMEGLGYSKNREPFLRLARNLTLYEIKNLCIEVKSNSSRSTINIDKLEAVLFGISGLLPKLKEIQEPEARSHVSHLKKIWKEISTQYKGELLQRADWQFFPTRPTNFPAIRLAAAKEMILYFFTNDLFRRIIQIIKDNAPPKDKIKKSEALFDIKANSFWKKHYHFNLPASKNVCPLGITRIHEIIVNTILPVSLLYARIFKDRAVREGVLSIYRTLPAPESNSIVRIVEKQLLRNKLKADSVCKHQAIIQLYKYYCIEKRCADCEVGQIIFTA